MPIESDLLSLTLRTIPIGISHAIWSGGRVALISLIGWLVYRQPLDAAGIIGIALIVAGVFVPNAFSKGVPH